MLKKTYLTIFATTFFIVLVNYFTEFMFRTNQEILILLWTIINVIIFPIWMISYIYRIAKHNKQEHFIPNTLFVLTFYLLTYINPSLNSFNFQTFSFNGDRASVAILKTIMYSGLLVLIFTSILLHIKLYYYSKSIA